MPRPTHIKSCFRRLVEQVRKHDTAAADWLIEAAKTDNARQSVSLLDTHLWSASPQGWRFWEEMFAKIELPPDRECVRCQTPRASWQFERAENDVCAECASNARAASARAYRQRERERIAAAIRRARVERAKRTGPKS